MLMLTLKQIEKNSVSVSTVSKALNDSPKLVIKQIRIKEYAS
jgi:DNA-binding LacI/PurR family transcriptional regulator